MALYPGAEPADHAPASYPQNDYFTSTAGAQNTDQGDGRVDYRINDKDSLFGSLSWSNTEQVQHAVLPGRAGWRQLQRRHRRGSGPQCAVELHAHLDPHAYFRNARWLQPAGNVARTQANPDKDLFKAIRHRRLQPHDHAQRRSPADQSAATAIARSAPTTGCRPRNTTTSGTSSKTWPSPRAPRLKFGAEFRPIKFPFFQVPYPHGEMNFARTETAFPSTATIRRPERRRSARDTGDEIASFLLGAIDNGQISTTNFISSTKQAWAVLRPGRLEGHSEADRERRPALRALLADRRAVRPPVELRSTTR